MHKNEKVGVLKPFVDVCEWREAGDEPSSNCEKPRYEMGREDACGAQDLSTTQKDAAM